MGCGWLNLGSLVCGLAGWIVPCLGLRKGRIPGPDRQGMAAAFSLTLCGLALWMQLRYQQHLADIGDWSALMDTAGPVTGVGAFLLLSTVLLNLALLYLVGRAGEEREPPRSERS